VFDPSTALRSRAWVEVRLDRLRENALAVQHAVGPTARLIPMVKANAYGLGVGPVVRALADDSRLGPPWAFGVAAVAEGEAIRELSWTGRVLVMAPAAPGELRRAALAGLTPCLSDLDSVRRWADLAGEIGRKLPFHLEIDTGMGRAGFLREQVDEWGPAVAAIADDRLFWEGCFTHFHSADEPDLASTDLQWRRFTETVDRLPARYRDRLVTHVANSAAAIRRGGFGIPLARPGIYMYGGSAGDGAMPLPVASLRARLVLVKEVPAGSTVGYGATYTAQRRERWGTLAIGYGDGLPRALARAGGEVILGGVRVPIIGRISMDVTTIDLSALPDARPGDVATLIGRDGEEEIGVDEVAGRCGTISYEILTGLTTRLPRVYLEGEEELGPAGGWDGNPAV
jgi:alanine racemase